MTNKEFLQNEPANKKENESSFEEKIEKMVAEYNNLLDENTVSTEHIVANNAKLRQLLTDIIYLAMEKPHNRWIIQQLKHNNLK